MRGTVNETTNGERPGLLRMAGALVRAPFERLQLSETIARHERLSLEAANVTLQEIARRVQPDDDELDGMLLGNSGERDLDPQTSRDLRERAVEASLRNEHCVGYLRSLGRFVMGEGPTFDEPELSDEQKAAVDAWWDRFTEANGWDQMEDELPRRLWRDGEFFLREFVHRRDGPIDGWQPSSKALRHLARKGVTVSQAALAPPDHPAGMTFFRFIPAEQIDDPDGVITHGVLTAAEDVCTPLGYCYAPPDEHGVPRIREVIPASEVRHSKIRVDQDVKRGRSALEPILKRSKQFDQWVNYRIVLNLVRSAVVLIKKISGSGSQLATVRSAQDTQRDTGLNDRKQRMLKPGTTIHATPNIEYEYLSPNLQAQDAQHDGRMLQLTMAAATGLPEYMMTGDASNANFASTMVAESPAVREFEDWQDTLRSDFRWVRRRVLRNAAEYRQIPLTPEDVDNLDIEVEFPPMMARDRKADAETDEILNRMHVKSAETIATEHGLDYDVEKQRVRQEREADIDFLPPMFMDPATSGAE